MTQHSSPRSSTRGPARRWRWAALAGVAVIALVGCTGATSDSSSMSMAEQPAASAEQQVEARDQAAPSEAAAESGAGGAEGDQAAEAPSEAGVGYEPTVVTADRDVIRTATVSVTVEVPTTGDNDSDTEALRNAVTDASLKVRGLVGAEGYVSASDSSGRVAVLTLRIPAAGYQAAIEGLSAIGQVSSLQEQAEDVTAQMVDLESRVKTMTASVERVRALLAQASSLDDVVALESELASREADLESIQSQRAALAGQTSLSTVTITVTGAITGTEVAVVEEPAEEATGFLAGLSKGWDAFVNFGAGALAVVGAILPFVPVLAVVGLLGWWLYRTLTRRTATPALAGPVQPHDGDVSR